MKHLRPVELKNIHERFLSPFFPSLIIIQQLNADKLFRSLLRSLLTLREVQIHRRAESTPSSFDEKKDIDKKQMVSTGLLCFCSEACTAT